MAEAYRNIIIADSQVGLARLITETLAPVGGKDMYNTPLSPTGLMPATHWISSGFIDANYAALLPLFEWNKDENGDWVKTVLSPGYPEVVMNMCLMADPPLEVTLAKVRAIFDASDVTLEQPFAAMTRMDLQIVRDNVLDN
jgi:hypothetical protein